jgi:alkylated DNA nucleotide flippase Atl1
MGSHGIESSGADGSIPKGAKQRELLAREGVPMRNDRVDLQAARVPSEF